MKHLSPSHLPPTAGFWLQSYAWGCWLDWVTNSAPSWGLSFFLCKVSCSLFRVLITHCLVSGFHEVESNEVTDANCRPVQQTVDRAAQGDAAAVLGASSPDWGCVASPLPVSQPTVCPSSDRSVSGCRLHSSKASLQAFRQLSKAGDLLGQFLGAGLVL